MGLEVRSHADCPRQFESEDELVCWIGSLLEVEADVVKEFRRDADGPLWAGHNERFRLFVRSRLPFQGVAVYSALLDQLRDLFRDPNRGGTAALGSDEFGPDEALFNFGLRAGAWWWTTSEQQHIANSVRRVADAEAGGREAVTMDVQREAPTLEALSEGLAVAKTMVDDNGDVLAELCFGTCNPTGRGLLAAIRHLATTSGPAEPKSIG